MPAQQLKRVQGWHGIHTTHPKWAEGTFGVSGPELPSVAIESSVGDFVIFHHSLCTPLAPLVPPRLRDLRPFECAAAQPRGGGGSRLAPSSGSPDLGRCGQSDPLPEGCCLLAQQWEGGCRWGPGRFGFLEEVVLPVPEGGARF